jgi:error-prone DNA polymerase
VFEKNRRAVLGSRMLAVKGQLQREGLVIHIIAREFTDMTPWLLQIAGGHDFDQAAAAPADDEAHEEIMRRQQEMAQRQARDALPVGRNFH